MSKTRRRAAGVLAVLALSATSVVVPSSLAVSGNSPKSPGSSTHFSNNGTPCTVSGNQQCPSPNQR